jgi:hypothetical protein
MDANSTSPGSFTFEERELQIRPNQLAIVQQLQTNPGSVIQLNGTWKDSGACSHADT